MPYARQLDDEMTVLRSLRRKASVKSGAFAGGLPCVRSTYINVENGLRPASLELWEAIAQRLSAALGTPVEVDQLAESAAKKPSKNEPGLPPQQPTPAPKTQPRRHKDPKAPPRHTQARAA